MSEYRYAGVTAAVAALLQIGEREGISLTRTKVAKLLYLADLRAAEDGMLGTSGMPWIWYNYGPWARELILAEDALVRDGVATRQEGENYYGSKQVSISLRRAPQFEIDQVFFGIVAQIVREYGHLSPSSLKDLTYSTAPMIEAQRTQRGTRLDLDSARPVKPVSGALRRLAKHRQSREPLGQVSTEVRDGLRDEIKVARPSISRANGLIL